MTGQREDHRVATTQVTARAGYRVRAAQAQNLVPDNSRGRLPPSALCHRDVAPFGLTGICENWKGLASGEWLRPSWLYRRRISRPSSTLPFETCQAPCGVVIYGTANC
jgi:hypothetical protein